MNYKTNMEKIDNVYYSLNYAGRTAEVTSSPFGEEYKGIVIIPDKVTYNDVVYSVTEIDRCAFYKCAALTEVIIGDHVIRIGEYAFYDCKGLTTLTIGKRVTEIGMSAFENCESLKMLTIPSHVTKISEDAFDGCSGLEKIVVEKDNPCYDSRWNCNAIISTKENALTVGCKNTTILDSVTKIASCAFCSCESLTVLVIPKSVTEIASSAFQYCSGLEKIIVEKGNPCYDSRKNCNAIIRTEDNVLLVGCKTTCIPNSVTEIDDAAFFGCESLTKITIPDSVIKIGEDAFGYCI